MYEDLIKDIKFNADDLIPAIVQDHKDKQVLMVAYMNKEALAETLDTGFMCYWSRSRKQMWRKGESSGHRQKLVEAFIDCDKDTLLFTVEQDIAACHEGYRSCFYRKIEDGKLKVIAEKVFDKEKVYK
jgi:phosphoribosyl-AMP cyclohydrolase